MGDFVGGGASGEEGEELSFPLGEPGTAGEEVEAVGRSAGLQRYSDEVAGCEPGGFQGDPQAPGKVHPAGGRVVIDACFSSDELGSNVEGRRRDSIGTIGGRQ